MDDKMVIPSHFSFAGKFKLWKRTAKLIKFKRIFQCFIFQHIFRINSDVPWPVHFSSTVSSSDNIKYKEWDHLCPKLGLSIGCYIQAINGIEVGINLRAGPGVKIMSANHDVNDYDKHSASPPIKFGDDIWLGANVAILPGVELGNHTIVAAGAVVTKSFKNGNCILAGVPAKVVKELPDYSGGQC